MGYRVIDVGELEPLEGRSATTRSITNAAGFETLGVRMYDVAPGEQMPLKYHYHEKQEEAFYVVEGDLHVETPEKTYVVPEGDVFVVEPESPQRAHNPEDADGTVRVFAAGAPTSDPGRAYEGE